MDPVGFIQCSGEIVSIIMRLSGHASMPLLPGYQPVVIVKEYLARNLTKISGISSVMKLLKSHQAFDSVAQEGGTSELENTRFF